MGFKLLVIGSKGSPFVNRMIALVDELMFNVHHVDETLLASSSPDDIWPSSAPSLVIVLDEMSALSEPRRTQAFEFFADKCREHGVPMLLRSSFHVLAGQTLDSPINETVVLREQANRSQGLLLESIVCKAPKHLIIRTGWVMDDPEYGLFSMFLPKLFKAETIFPSDHHFGRPVYVRNVCDTLVAMIQQVLSGADNWGVLHFSASDQCSEAEFVDYLVRMVNTEFSGKVLMPEIASVEDDRKVMPENGNLIGVRCTDNFGIQLQSWRNGLKQELAQYLKRHGLG